MFYHFLMFYLFRSKSSHAASLEEGVLKKMKNTELPTQQYTAMLYISWHITSAFKGMACAKLAHDINIVQKTST